MNPYRAAPKAACWSVTFRCRLQFDMFMECTTLLTAISEDDAVRQCLKRHEEQGSDIVALVDAHRVFA